MWRSI